MNVIARVRGWTECLKNECARALLVFPFLIALCHPATHPLTQSPPHTHTVAHSLESGKEASAPPISDSQLVFVPLKSFLSADVFYGI